MSALGNFQDAQGDGEFTLGRSKLRNGITVLCEHIYGATLTSSGRARRRTLPALSQSNPVHQEAGVQDDKLFPEHLCTISLKRETEQKHKHRVTHQLNPTVTLHHLENLCGLDPDCQGRGSDEAALNGLTIVTLEVLLLRGQWNSTCASNMCPEYLEDDRGMGLFLSLQ
ncbi:hypothetical protein P7K49_021006, partial [Saguinus oedipus]